MTGTLSGSDTHDRPEHLRLGQLLRQRRLISDEQLQQALLYQRQHRVRLGDALLALNHLDRRTLNRALRRQRWLSPCAACIVLLSPLTLVWAQTPEDEQEIGFTQDWLELNPWSYVQTEVVNSRSDWADVLSFVALNGWQLWQGEKPEPGDFSLSVKQPDKDGLELRLTMRF